MSDLWLPDTVEGFHELHREISSYREESESKWIEWSRAYGEASTYYLARFILSTRNPEWVVNGKQALDHEFPLWLARDLDDALGNTLRLIAREHLKSTLSTFAKTINLVVRDPNDTIAIVSDQLKLSTKFCKRIDTESTSNPLLRMLWPDIFWERPKDSPLWSLGGSGVQGLIYQRTSNVTEATVTPVGLDSAPETGPHYNRLRYDDIVTWRNTRTTRLMQVTRANLKASYSLGKDGGTEDYVGTLYHPADAYHDMMQDEGMDVRVIRVPCRKTLSQGRKRAVYYSEPYLVKKEKLCGDEEFAIQWKLDPGVGKVDRIELSWVIQYDPEEPVDGGPMTMLEQIARRGLTYMTVDGAGGEKDESTDYTTMQVWSAQMDESHVLMDAVRDRLDPAERIDAAFRLHQKWGQYRFQFCNWESYGMDSDVFYLKQKMVKTGNSFPVNVVAGNRNKEKEKRITGRLFPIIKAGRLIVPERLFIECKYLGGGQLDYTQALMDQLHRWPLVENDDDIDCASRLYDPKFPLIYPSRSMSSSAKKKDMWGREKAPAVGGSWVA